MKNPTLLNQDYFSALASSPALRLAAEKNVDSGQDSGETQLSVADAIPEITGKMADQLAVTIIRLNLRELIEKTLTKEHMDMRIYMASFINSPRFGKFDPMTALGYQDLLPLDTSTKTTLIQAGSLFLASVVVVQLLEQYKLKELINEPVFWIFYAPIILLFATTAASADINMRSKLKELKRYEKMSAADKSGLISKADTAYALMQNIYLMGREQNKKKYEEERELRIDREEMSLAANVLREMLDGNYQNLRIEEDHMPLDEITLEEFATEKVQSKNFFRLENWDPDRLMPKIEGEIADRLAVKIIQNVTAKQAITVTGEAVTKDPNLQMMKHLKGEINPEKEITRYVNLPANAAMRKHIIDAYIAIFGVTLAGAGAVMFSEEMRKHNVAEKIWPLLLAGLVGFAVVAFARFSPGLRDKIDFKKKFENMPIGEEAEQLYALLKKTYELSAEIDKCLPVEKEKSTLLKAKAQVCLEFIEDIVKEGGKSVD